MRKMSRSLTCTRCWERIFASNQICDMLSGCLQSTYVAAFSFGYFTDDTTVRDLRQASAEGCHLCKYIVDQQKKAWKASDDSAGVAVLLSFISYPVARLVLVVHTWADFLKFRDGRHIPASVELQEDLDLHFTIHNDTGTLNINEIDPQLRKDSLESFADAREWVNECVEFHDQCPKRNDEILPSRVLDLVNSQSPIARLVNTKGEKAKYTALSYCWGGPQLAMTTKTTLDSYLGSVTIAELPATIRDAIRVTREIGVRYLWVDSLCIVQDDQDDKERQIKNMPRIYGNAYCTIMASSAKSVTEGFLQDNTHLDLPPLFLPCQCPDGEVTELRLMRSAPYARGKEPINNRAWTLQERLLSTRCLNYTTHSMNWYCRKLRRDNGPPVDAGTFPGDEEIPSGSSVFQWTNRRTQPDQIHRSWQSLVELYSLRKLTDPTDKLSALAGIAYEYQLVIGGDYLAGLWSKYLIFDLLWWCDSYPKHARVRYRAPSWSWASVSESISFAYFEFPREENLSSKVKVIDCGTKPAHDVDTLGLGRVRDAWLKIEGLTKTAIWDPIKGRILDEGCKTLRSEVFPDALETVTCHVDVITCLAVTDIYGLALRPVGDGTFRRVGFFKIENEKGSDRSPSLEAWFGRATPHVLTIA